MMLGYNSNQTLPKPLELIPIDDKNDWYESYKKNQHDWYHPQRYIYNSGLAQKEGIVAYSDNTRHLLDALKDCEVSLFGMKSKVRDLDPRYWSDFEIVRNNDSLGYYIRALFRPNGTEAKFVCFNINDTEVSGRVDILYVMEQAVRSFGKEIEKLVTFSPTKDLSSELKNAQELLVKSDRENLELHNQITDLRCREMRLMDDVEFWQGHVNTKPIENIPTEALLDEVLSRGNRKELILKEHRKKKPKNVIDFNKAIENLNLTEEEVDVITRVSRISKNSKMV